MPKKKFKDTKVGQFLKNKAPDILDAVGDVLPDKGAVGIVKRIISKSDKLTEEDKEIAMRLIDVDIQEMQEVSNRWDADMHSDSWLSKNIRPLILAYSWLLLTVSMLFAWGGNNLPDSYVMLFETLTLTVTGGYFGLRTIEKRNQKKYD